MPDQPDPEQWRTGRTIGRTLYVGDRFIGHAESDLIASIIVGCVNARAPLAGADWWHAGRLVFNRPGADLTTGWVAAVDTPEQARHIVTAVTGQPDRRDPLCGAVKPHVILPSLTVTTCTLPIGHSGDHHDRRTDTRWPVVR